MTVHSTQSDALHLVMVLIKHKLCRVDVRDVWSLFESTAIRPTSASLCFLATFLDGNGAPEHGQNTSAVKKSVRSQLLNWLVCCRTELSDDDFIPATMHLDVRLMSEILIALTMRCTHVSHNCTCGVLLPAGLFADIERMCLLTTFHDAIQLPSCISSGSSSAGNRVTRVSDSSVLYCRQEQLLTNLSTDVDYAVTYAKPEVRVMLL